MPHPSRFFNTAGILFLLASALAVYLTYAGLIRGGISGCGAGCESLLSGPWGKVYPGIPVGLPAFFVYATLTGLAFTRRSFWITWMLCGMVMGAAIWFTAIQITENSFCPFCTGAHVCAVLGSVALCQGILSTENGWTGFRSSLAPALGGGVLALGLALVQLFFPVSDSRTGRYTLNSISEVSVAELPSIGAPEGDAISIMLFDFCCLHCRIVQEELLTMHDEFTARKKRLLLLPAPLNSKCNPDLDTSLGPGFEQACEYASVMLGLWRRDPETYWELLDHLLVPGVFLSLEEVELLAGGPPEGEVLTWVNRQIRTGTRVYHETSLSTGIPALPMILDIEGSGSVRTLQGDIDTEKIRSFLLNDPH